MGTKDFTQATQDLFACVKHIDVEYCRHIWMRYRVKQLNFFYNNKFCKIVIEILQGIFPFFPNKLMRYVKC